MTGRHLPHVDRSVRHALLAGMVVSAFLAAPCAAADPPSGAQLFKRYCAGCHGADGRGGAHTFMPHVDTLTKAGYIELVPDDYLMLVIREGGPSVGKSSYMPAWESTLSPNEITDIVAHIRSLARR